MTNGDRIRSMTDEEMAKAIYTYCSFDCYDCGASYICSTKNLGCEGSIAYWLKQEVDENG